MDKKSLELTDDNLRKIRILRDALAKYNPVRSGTFAAITIPVAATEAAQFIAQKHGIPITKTGICFIINSEEDLDRAITQFQAFAADVEEFGKVLPAASEE